MVFQYCSDLHLELRGNRKWLEQNPIIPKGEILLLAGDILNLKPGFEKDPFFDFAADHFQQTYLLPGNHEYYNAIDASEAIVPKKEAIRSNVWLVNHQIIQPHPNISLIFSTLWSEISSNYGSILKYITDFKKIKYKGTLLTIPQFNKLHHASKAYLAEAIHQTDKQIQIVITHHLPSPLCNVKEFENSKTNGAFCAELTNMIEQSTVNYWLYGHSHRNKASFKIGNTTLLTNQLGYIIRSEQYGYSREAVIEVSF